MKRALLTALFLSAGLAACNGTPELITPPGQLVLINSSHEHTIYCGHYRYGGRWYYEARHVHGINCGHDHEGDEWVLES